MLNGFAPTTDAPEAGSRLVAQAAAILAREVAQMPASLLGSAAPTALAPGAAVPNFELPVPAAAGTDVDSLRRQAHDLIEALLTVASPKAGLADDRVALLRGPAPVAAGSEVRVPVRVANEESTPASVSLYCSNFVSDSGFDIPSLRVAFSPRVATIPAKSELTFEVKVSVPEQAPPGLYSGLVQASGSKYLKAVISLEVK